MKNSAISIFIIVTALVVSGCSEADKPTEITILTAPQPAEKKIEKREKRRTGAIPGNGQKYDPGNLSGRR